MISFSLLAIFVYFNVSIFASKNVEGSRPVLERTIESLFSRSLEETFPTPCRFIVPSNKQSKICKQQQGVVKMIALAKEQAIDACEKSFEYDRWNCSVVFNNKKKKNIFKKIYRETAFIHTLMAASLTHAVAKSCASGLMTQCSCRGNFGKNMSLQWKRSGCGDDFKYGKRFTRNFLDLKNAGSDQIADILKQDIIVGLDSIGEQLKEVCKCHGFSGSCTTKTCWKKLAPFPSVMGALKKSYHHAVKKKVVNYTSKRAVTPKMRRKLKLDKKKMLYLHRTPNLCVSTAGRVCKDRNNCATLCCGRGYVTSKVIVKTKCKCKMVNCCFVACETCSKEEDLYTCK